MALSQCGTRVTFSHLILEGLVRSLRNMIPYRVVRMLGRGPRDKKAPKLKTFSSFSAGVALWGDTNLHGSAVLVFNMWRRCPVFMLNACWAACASLRTDRLCEGVQRRRVPVSESGPLHPSALALRRRVGLHGPQR